MENIKSNIEDTFEQTPLTTNTITKDDIERLEYFVTDMAEHQYLRDHGVRYNFVKVIGKTTVYKYPRTIHVLALAKEFSDNNFSLAEYWVLNMREHKMLREAGIRFNFVKKVNGITVYKYPKTEAVYNCAVEFTRMKNEELAHADDMKSLHKVYSNISDLG